MLVGKAMVVLGRQSMVARAGPAMILEFSKAFQKPKGQGGVGGAPATACKPWAGARGHLAHSAFPEVEVGWEE